ncbi:hypothetical protein GCM10010306_026960 [Streptomyces umbrinus]|nr:hypothetical protein GCM10010306_026960 [Streptomyces umbrinus]GHH41806.1 hypothetical protein GCM10018775_25560 [Streptomyces umbrinus]
MVLAQWFEALHGDLSAQRLVPGTPHLTHPPSTDQVEQPVPALDQPGVPHLLRSPPSLGPALPWLVQYGELSSDFVRGPPRAGAEP